MKCFAYQWGALLAVLLFASQSVLPAENGIVSLRVKSHYSWETVRIGNTAELVSLLCHGCGDLPDHENEVPLLSVLRDTLGDASPENDRLSYLWLLTYSPPTLRQRILSGVPFFYWRMGDGSDSESHSMQISPLLDLTSVRHPMISSFGRDLLQWTVLDPAATPVRATSREYRTNQIDQERLHLEETIAYLHQAAGDDLRSGLTTRELNTVVARLELRKTLLGGFVREEEAARVGEDEILRSERIRGRNWELLRQCADKTGLYFEPLDLAGSSGQYALLWFPLDQDSEPDVTGLSSVFKLLDIKNPWRDARLKAPSLRFWTRDVDEKGNLLRPGLTGVQQVKLVPLGAYSLSYPKAPLLLVDFRDRRHVRWHEVTQRSINEITAGVIGISHFTNWYYYVAADAYNFVVARHGGATSRAERLDCYSQFRVALQLDAALDPELRKDMQKHIDSLAINPLESAPKSEIAAASLRYDELKDQAQTGSLEKRIDKNRREELASDTETGKERFCDYVLHVITFGAYTHRTKPDSSNDSLLDNYRRAQYQLAFLDRVSAGGAEPEVAYDPAIITRSITELESVMPGISSNELREHAAFTLNHIKSLSQNSRLQADCSNALAALERGPRRDMQPAPQPPDVGVVAGGDGLE